MRYSTPAGFLIMLLFYILISCSSDPTEMSDVEIIELDEYETLASFEDNLLSTPVILRFDGGSSLFVYDIAESKVVELDREGNQINEFGRRGEGPGEIWFLNNIYLIENELFLVDTGRYLIHRYDRNGTHISSLDYGDFLIKKHDAQGEYQSAFYYPVEKPALSREEAMNSVDDHEQLQDAVQSMQIPDTWPALQRMFADNTGRLWVSVYTENDEINKWYILEESGELLARFVLPGETTIARVNDNSLYTRETDEETDLQQVVRYRVEL